tara:strand:- start:20 stop:199 length:180 start_codon:yes stop_codon:yes gene_type:complete
VIRAVSLAALIFAAFAKEFNIVLLFKNKYLKYSRLFCFYQINFNLGLRKYQMICLNLFN